MTRDKKDFIRAIEDSQQALYCQGLHQDSSIFKTLDIMKKNLETGQWKISVLNIANKARVLELAEQLIEELVELKEQGNERAD